MEISPSQTVANIVLDHAETAEVFQRHRIDFCCRGDRSIEAAARERGVEPSVLMAQLEQAIAARKTADRPTAKELSTPALLDHIVDTHHAYLRKTLPYLQPLATKVARVHGDRNPKLRELAELVGDLVEIMIPHLDEEEQSLFPALRAGSDEVGPLLDTMVDDHLEVAALLERIRAACDDFTIPDWACSSYRALFGELAAVEQDTFTHVHLENHVLVPRFRAAAPALRFDLAAEAAALRETDAWREGRHTAKTLVRETDSRVVLIALPAGAQLLEHKTDHSIIVQVLTGRVQLATPQERIELEPLGMLFLEASVPHDLVAHEDSTVLLTINWNGKRG